MKEPKSLPANYDEKLMEAEFEEGYKIMCAINEPFHKKMDTIFKMKKKHPIHFRLYEKDSVLYRIFIAFAIDILNFHELQQIMSNINLNIFKKDFKTYQWYKYYNDYKKLPPFMLKLKCSLKLILKKRLYFLYNFLKGSKRETECHNTCL